jgi:pyruvate/2-oxoglutarate dehydrogenase complex dihydrolipoamide dehydrogenase (E3) component
MTTVMSETFKNDVIGSGEAGKWLTWTLAGQGEPTVVVERSLVGGACPNVACLPSKNVIYSAKVASLVQHAASFGVMVPSATVDMSGVIRRKQSMVDGERDFHLRRFRDCGAELLFGHAAFTEAKTVRVTLSSGETRTLRGERVFLAVGTRASLPAVPGLAAAQPMTHVQTLDLDHLPEHLVVLGGGYVGLEFAQALRRFGSRVTIVERGARLLEREDAEFSDALTEILREDGIEILLHTDVLKVSGRSGESVHVELRSASAARSIEATDLLVATGRTPNTDRLGVDKARIELDARGYVRVNERLECTAEGVWAMGECAGSPQFTHVSFDDFRIVRDNLAGGSRSTRDRIIPYTLFTDPELAHVGLTETAAKAQGLRYRVEKLPMASVLRTHTHGDTRGMIKALVGDDDHIVGFTALGVEASELMAAVQVAMVGKLPYTVFRTGIFAHPTTAEGLTALFAAAPSAS